MINLRSSDSLNDLYSLSIQFYCHTIPIPLISYSILNPLSSLSNSFSTPISLILNIFLSSLSSVFYTTLKTLSPPFHKTMDNPHSLISYIWLFSKSILLLSIPFLLFLFHLQNYWLNPFLLLLIFISSILSHHD